MGLFELYGGEHSEGAVQAAFVVPVDVAGGGVLDIGDGLVRPVVEDRGADALGLVQADHALHQPVIEGIADGPDRGRDAFDGEVLVEEYLAERERLGDEIRARIEALYPPEEGLRAKLLARLES